MRNKRAIVWFRQDLRLHDNEALLDAIASADEIIPVYVFDERVFKGKTRYGFPKTGKYRARFIIESVHDLRTSLRALGSELIVRVGKPEEIIYDLANKAKSSWVFCNRERTEEEVAVQDALEQNLWSIGQEIRYSRGKMLYYTADLPFPVTHTPDVFTQFRKEVERFVAIRHPLPRPETFEPVFVLLEPGEIPRLEDFGHEDDPADSRAVLDFKGGELEGLKRLKEYVWDTEHIRHYKDTRDNLMGTDYSSKLSPWLAQGCISPKTVYYEVKTFEKTYGQSESTYGLLFELLWRDFFRFMAKKHGNKVFQEGGIQEKTDPDWKNDEDLLQSWVNGQTGIPFIDANMREIKQTGYMSNRGRLNTASFLVNDLKVNWQMGADYFESVLIDYDVCSNYGNWQFVAGVGSDSREHRELNILAQAKRYDPQGDFVRLWLPELAEVPQDKIHQPDSLSEMEQRDFHFQLGRDYPAALVDTGKWN
ncbi:DASH family cryptochrome [Flavilitoribacter nigricans]|uniref:Cryptochrome DASH n=1 Tax=Flavilitoribacter nigricans (strain ATCC 23147 / DSM 23189 / NBRC 102662 / NCIMB 1420 / SS-2) TaxID=1122177 RepID=A0A2D0NCB5_FLAN2|nr:DASH family cryptochrome [Flavilitoribacter nigricans]PHN06038.1 cryptochrome DASH [Flavilitoribacter nigricans DSM 23189 = NBRC 102662]